MGLPFLRHKLSAAQIVSASGPVTPPYANTKSLVGDGVDDYLSLSFDANTELGTGALTIAFFFKYIDNSSTQNCMYFGDTAAKNIIQINNGGTSGVLQAVCRKTGSNAIAESTLTPANGTWYHAIATRSGTTLNLWVNNANNGTITNSEVDSNISSANCNILRHRTGYVGLFLEGNIDEFAVWNIAADSDMRDAIYNSGEAHDLALIEPDNLKLYHRFEEKDGTTITDLSGNGYDATLTSGADIEEDTP